MQISKKIYLTLLPLAIFLCLSCPIKHEIKQVLNIATAVEVDLEKNNHLRPCLAAFSKEDLSHTSEKHADVQYPLLRDTIYLGTSSLLADVQTSVHEKYDEAISPIPLFIYHRKLII